MISPNDKSLCCGCGSCSLTCHTKAIKMVEDEVGFVFPRVDKNLCNNCGLCEKKCPVLNHENEIDVNHEVYIAHAKDNEIRFMGSSGGMFGLIARNILEQDGVVFGAAFDDNLQLKCTSATTVDELFSLYKSKYLQSDLGDSFLKIRELLNSDRKVLFVSTPCQVYALKLFLDKDYCNLTTVDFVCHGVPSQHLFDKCRSYVERKENISLVNYTFRVKKKNGATPHYYRKEYTKFGKAYSKVLLYTDSPFYYGFQKYITLRDSCYGCRFAFSNRVSDLTIGDFHEVDKYINGINRFDGISHVVINTENGKKLWEKIRNKTVSYELDFNELIDNKELMCGNTVRPANRDQFITDLKNKTFDDVVAIHLDGKKQYVKKLYYSMPKFFRKILKKVMIR